ncbi:penicillin-binding protein [Colletotrichum navitas]|uniref:Penicillin-binding protein n=1 Tax=Colletotrichum navitas TaxID=681940 RepID=A0AAD8PK77_9PEZI|nr:penicillin-binding protein [Colletotrichum navitas]KAK1566385.1 penicillin-binding protein [Colletotrichum navitas]
MYFRAVLALFSLCGLYSISLAAATPLPPVQARFNLDSATYAANAQAFKASGYRIISLSSYGSPPDNKYAAVWVKREGTDQVTISGTDLDGYRTWIVSWKSKGYVPTHVSASGPATGAVFAAVMERANVGRWSQQCGITNPQDFHPATNISGIVQDYSTYGTPSDRRYCVLVYENIGTAMETIFYDTAGTSEFAAIYDSELTKTFWRPKRLFVADDKRITPQFASDSVGTWAAKIGLTADQLDAELKSKQRQGRLYPIHIDGAGTGQDARFSAIFAESDVPEARKWTVTGKAGDPAMTAKLDAVMEAWMKKNGVRQAQVAGAEKGTIIFERSYTWAESNRAPVKPDDVFLLASLSKMFVYAAIDNLIRARKLKLSTRVYKLLGFKRARDRRAFTTTIDHLLSGKTGFDRARSGDPGFEFRQAAQYFYNSARPASLRDVIEYQLAKPLDSKPGKSYVYSNYGSMVLGYVVSQVSRQPYFEFLKKNILGGLDVRVFRTAASQHVSDRIIQDTRFTGLDGSRPASNAKVSSVFGGDGAIKEECDAAFSLAASASTIAKFIGNHAVWGIGGRTVSRRQGTLPGARSFAASEKSGLDWAITINTRDVANANEIERLRFKLLEPLFVNPKSCSSWLKRPCVSN